MSGVESDKALANAIAKKGINDKDGLLTEPAYELVVRNLPLICVDFLPVDYTRRQPRLGIITRATGPEAGKPAMLGGRIKKDEGIADAIHRHLFNDLRVETFNFHGGNAADRPVHVAEYAHRDHAEGGYDPSKHAIALTYLINIYGGSLSPQNEAADFRWIGLDEIPEVSAYNHHLAMQKAADFLQGMSL